MVEHRPYKAAVPGSSPGVPTSIKYSTLTKIEGGVVTKPSVQTMAKIAKALGVSIEDLI